MPLKKKRNQIKSDLQNCNLVLYPGHHFIFRGGQVSYPFTEDTGFGSKIWNNF